MDDDSLIPIERIASQIYVIRGEKVMLDADLAMLYAGETRVLNRAVTRNPERFPEDCMFRLSVEEFESSRSQAVISSWGGRRYAPRAFTEQGVAMLSTVLRSACAVQASIAIMRTFVRLRQVLATHEELAHPSQGMSRWDSDAAICVGINRYAELPRGRPGSPARRGTNWPG